MIKLKDKTIEANSHYRYVRITNKMVQAIHDGEFHPGERLPGIRTLALKYKVGRQVMHHALQLLSAQDYVYAEPKRGVFVNPKISVGHYYQIGYYLNDCNPMQNGLSMQAIYQEAMLRHYRSVFGYNFAGHGESVSQFYESVPQMDGIIVSGEIDESFLREVRATRIPYLVLGNYAIHARHPCYRVDIPDIMEKLLTPVFRPFAGKRIGALFGLKEYQTDCDTMLGVRRVIQAIGNEPDDSLLKFCGMDGFEETAELLTKKHLDALYIQGGQRVGYAQFRELHPDVPAPHVILNKPGEFPLLHPGIFDETVECELLGEKEIRQACAMLINMLEGHPVKQ